MGKVIDVEIHPIHQTSLVGLDSKGNITIGLIMKEVEENLGKQKKEKTNG